MPDLKSPAHPTPLPTARDRAPIRTAVEAVSFLRELGRSMDDLTQVMEEEAELVRKGKLRAAAELQPRKQERADRYVSLMIQARDEAQALGRFAPVETASIRKRHMLFKAEIQINLAVLATAREVAEDLLRSAAREVEDHRRPNVYGRPGQHQQKRPTLTQGIAYDRSL